LVITHKSLFTRSCTAGAGGDDPRHVCAG